MPRDSLSRDDLSHFQTVKKFLDYTQLVSLPIHGESKKS